MQKMISRNKKKILIIKHGALGDFMLSFGPFAAIKKQHLRDHLVLLTTKTFIDFARESNYFDEIMKKENNFIQTGGRFIVPLPEPKIIEP